MIRTPLLLTALLLCQPAFSQSINFGDNSSEYANDGECDDRRFVGPGMTVALDWDETGHDSADCKKAFQMGTIKLWDQAAAKAATQCSQINFGDNSSEYARDDECDDPRFEGPGTDSIMLPTELGKDAADCKKACEFGTIFLRNY